MSSSARPAPFPRTVSGPAARPTAEPAAKPFPYVEVQGLRAARKDPAEPPPSSLSEAEPVLSGERENQLREIGRQQGITEAARRFEEHLLRERAVIAAAVAEFSKERAEYYRKIEHDAVQLSLSIARRILHREAETDPLLLMGVVRVALDQLESATVVQLAVHPERAAQWQSHFSQISVGKLPEVTEDPALALDECELRTSAGTARFGVEIQLKEIEQGLADLLAARPQGGR